MARRNRSLSMPNKPSVLIDRRKQAGVLPLELNPQHVDDIAAGQHVVQPAGDLDAELADALRHQGRRPAHDDPRPELQEAVDVAAGDSAVSDVAHQAHRQPLQPALDSPDREDIEQALSRVLVGPVAGIDDAAAKVLGQKMRRPGHGVPHHHDIDAHGLDVLGGVDEALAFADARSAGREIDGVGAQALGRKVEARPRARRRLEEEVDDHLALEIGQFLAPPLAHLDEFFSPIEDYLDLTPTEPLQV